MSNPNKAAVDILDGDKNKGRQYAKRAADLGRPELFDKWDAAKFGGRRRK